MAGFQLQGWLSDSVHETSYFSDLPIMGNELANFIKLNSSLPLQTSELTSNNLGVQLLKKAPWRQCNPL